MNYEKLPNYIKQYPYCCKFCINPIIDKTPLQINGSNAKVNDIETFKPFNDVVKTINNKYGVGVLITNQTLLCGIDIDKCINENGQYTQMAIDIVESIKSYTEKSISQTGVHILFLMDVEQQQLIDKSIYYTKNPHTHLEIYTSLWDNGKRYLTTTGNAINNYDVVKINWEQLHPVFEKYMKKEQQQNFNVVGSVNNAHASIDDALKLDNSFYNLWNGNTSNDDESSNDLALCNKLCYWLGVDFNAIDNAFMQSPYFMKKDAPHKQKWARADYKKMTIQKAIESCNAHPTTKSRNFVFNNVMASINEYEQEKPKYKIFTGFKQLDAITNGLQSGLNVIGGLSGTGKTTLANQICDYIAMHQKHVLYISLEMTTQQMLFKTISRLTNQNGVGLSINQIKDRIYNNDEQAKQIYDDAKTKLNAFAQYIHILDISNGIKNANDIIQAIEQCKNYCGYYPITFVDFIQRLETGNDKTIIDDNLSKLQDFGINHNLPIVVLSQLNRNANELIKGNQHFNALYGSNNIEQLATTIFIMHCNDDANKEIKTMYVDLVKNKEGATVNNIAFTFFSRYCKFVELQQEQQKEIRINLKAKK